MLWWIAIYFLSILYKRIHFSLPLNPEIHRMGKQHAKYSLSQMQRTKRVSTLFYILLQAFENYSNFISELINLKYAFNITFKITQIKIPIMGTSSQFHDSVQLNILPSLSSADIKLLNWDQERLLLRPGAPF